MRIVWNRENTSIDNSGLVAPEVASNVMAAVGTMATNLGLNLLPDMVRDPTDSGQPD